MRLTGRRSDDQSMNTQRFYSGNLKFPLTPTRMVIWIGDSLVALRNIERTTSQVTPFSLDSDRIAPFSNKDMMRTDLYLPTRLPAYDLSGKHLESLASHTIMQADIPTWRCAHSAADKT
ncbi:hypothetical protein CBL_11053 [Carabus blaptoides fortunei]